MHEHIRSLSSHQHEGRPCPDESGLAVPELQHSANAGARSESEGRPETEFLSVRSRPARGRVGQTGSVRRGRSGRVGQTGSVRRGRSGRVGQAGSVRQGRSGRVGQAGSVRQGRSDGVGQAGLVRRGRSGRVGQTGSVRQGRSGRVGQAGSVRQGWSGRVGQAGSVRRGRSGRVGQTGSVRRGRSDGVGQTGSVSVLEIPASKFNDDRRAHAGCTASASERHLGRHRRRCFAEDWRRSLCDLSVISLSSSMM